MAAVQAAAAALAAVAAQTAADNALAAATAAAQQANAGFAAMMHQMQAQQAAMLAQSILAEQRSLKLAARTAAGPAPTFKGNVPGLQALRWLNDIEAYFEVAQVIDQADRLIIAGSATRDAALVWWNQEKIRAVGDPDHIGDWAQFKAALGKRFLPQDTNRWARDELDTLQSKRPANVVEYTAHFEELLSLITDGMAASDQVGRYESGLGESLRRRCREKVFQTFGAAKEFALQAYRANVSSSSEGDRRPSFAGQRQGSAAHLHNTSASAVAEDEEDSFGQAFSSAPRDRFTAMEQQIATLTAMLTAASVKAGRGRDRKRSPGGASAQGSRRREHTPGLSKEVVAERIAAKQCIRCGESGHWKGDCKNAPKLGN